MKAILSTPAEAGEPIPVDVPGNAGRLSFGISYAPMLNVRAGFSGLGTFASPHAPQPAGLGLNRRYDDGYVIIDNTGNALGRTSYWGYQSATQYDPSVGGAINLSITNSLGNGRAGETEDISPGIELSSWLDMGSAGAIGARPITWGFRSGLHYSSISIGDSGSLTADVLRVPVASRFSLAAETGVNLAIAHGEYDFSSATTVSGIGLGTRSSSGSGDRTSVLPGFYAGLSAQWDITEDFSLHASARNQYLDNFNIPAGSSSATLDFDGAAVLSLGGIWKF